MGVHRWSHREASWRRPLLDGNLKSLLPLWENLAINQRYQPYIAKDDIKVFRKRAENEGLSFLTTTLPTVGKALDRYHSVSEWVCPANFTSQEVEVNGRTLSLPLFLGRAIKFALEGDSVAVDCVRQLTLIFYKYEVDHGDYLVEQFLDRFERTDQDLLVIDALDPSLSARTKTLITHMRAMIGHVLCNTDPTDIRPCHGTGVTSCQTKNENKYHTFRYIRKLDDVYPYDSHFFYSQSHLIDEIEKLEKATEVEPSARVCLVPKDSRGPRVISCEPAEFMFIQQGLMRKLYECLETHPLTTGHINFVDQSINRDLARYASKYGEFSTLDLSDASDRVSLSLVRAIFPANWVRCFEACRSENTVLPNGKVVKLNKFAPMGSACCFPVEALVFWACAEATMKLLPGYLSRSCFVYGDDIIIPSKFFDEVVEGLTSIGLLVNTDKSYRDGPFRESCGGDYHKDYDVTPVRVKKPLLSQGTGLSSAADLANLFIAKFGYDSVRGILDVIEDAVGYVFPRSELGIPCTIRSSSSALNDVFFLRRYNKFLQRVEHRILSPAITVITAKPPNWGELHRMELTKNPPSSSAFSVPDDGLSEFRNRYESVMRITNSVLEPGQYADIHSARTKWTWTWLG